MDYHVLANIDVTIAALLILLGIFVMSSRTTRTKDMRYFFFLGMTGELFILCVVSIVIELLERRFFYGARITLTLLETVCALLIDVWMLTLFLYNLYTIYQSRDYIRRAFWRYMTPFIIIVVLEILNAFTGFMWYYDANIIYHDTGLYTWYDVIRYAYVLASAIQVVIYRRQGGQTGFYRMSLYVLAIIIGTLTESFTGYYAFYLGAALGMAFLYMETANEIGFTDEESGFSTSQYLLYLYEQVNKGKYRPESILSYVLSEEDEISAFSRVLNSVLPEESETVRVGDREIVTFLETTERGMIAMLAEDVQMVAEEARIKVTTEQKIRKPNETEKAFFAENIRLNRRF